MGFVVYVQQIYSNVDFDLLLMFITVRWKKRVDGL